MWESLSPGMTVRPFASITLVAGPCSCRRILSLVPVALILPAVIAIASTNDGVALVAILALWMIVSAFIVVLFPPLITMWLALGGWFTCWCHDGVLQVARWLRP